METPIKTLIYYYHFLQTILHDSYKEVNHQLVSLDHLIEYKIGLLGQYQCGKSTYVKRFLNPQLLTLNYKPTVGVEFFQKRYQINNNNISIQLSLWDTAGEERFASLRPMYLRGSNTLIYTFDLSKQASFEYMKHLIKTNDYIAGEKIIIGFKRDLPRQVSLNQVEILLSEIVVISNEGISLKDLKIQYFEISSMIDTESSISFPLLFGLLMSEKSMLEKIAATIVISK